MDEIYSQWLKDPIVWKVVTALIVITVLNIAAGLIKRSLSGRIKDTASLYRIKKMVTFISHVVIILIIAGLFSDKLKSITVALGIAGAGIAFALQEVVVSVAGWIAITFGYFYRIGNRIQLGGIMGDVIDIGVLRTTLMECGQWVRGDQYNGRIVKVSNGYVFKEPVFNYSADFPFLWDEITIPVKYGSDFGKAREILMGVAYEVVGDYVTYARETWKEMVKKYMIEDAKVEPAVTTVANENWVEYTLRYVVDYKLRRTTKDRLFMRALEEISATQGRVMIASTSMDISLVQAADMNVRVEGGSKQE